MRKDVLRVEPFAGIGRTMMIADKYFKLFLRDALQPYGLNAAEGIVLLMLLRNEQHPHQTLITGKTQDELIREIHYDKGVMTRTTKELEQKGYVVREQHPADCRSYLFSLTEKGRQFRATLMEILRQWNEKLLGGISEEHLAVTEAALAKMAQNASLFYGETHLQNKTN